jgi:hypothetical protein
VVAPLAVLGLVVDDAVLDLDLADREVALEVRRVVQRVPEAELDPLNSDSRAGSERVFVTRTRQISSVSESGTKNSVCAAIPARREPDERVSESRGGTR